MKLFLYIVHVFVCLGMLPIILLQSGKGGGVSAVFGGGSSGTVFGSRGASNFLTRMTTICATMFMLTSFGLSLYSSKPSVVSGVRGPSQIAPNQADGLGAAEGDAAAADTPPDRPAEIPETAEPAADGTAEPPSGE